MAVDQHQLLLFVVVAIVLFIVFTLNAVRVWMKQKREKAFQKRLVDTQRQRLSRVQLQPSCSSAPATGGEAAHLMREEDIYQTGDLNFALNDEELAEMQQKTENGKGSPEQRPSDTPSPSDEAVEPAAFSIAESAVEEYHPGSPLQNSLLELSLSAGVNSCKPSPRAQQDVEKEY